MAKSKSVEELKKENEELRRHYMLTPLTNLWG
jgi:hypothetical protein